MHVRFASERVLYEICLGLSDSSSTWFSPLCRLRVAWEEFSSPHSQDRRVLCACAARLAVVPVCLTPVNL